MKYATFVSGTPKSTTRPQGDGAPYAGGDGMPYLETTSHPSMPAIKRFPPILQFLTETEPRIELQMQALGRKAYEGGQSVQQLCDALYHYARSIGYEATIGVQEVYSGSMPSFSGHTVLSTLLMIDMKHRRFANLHADL